MDMTREPPTGPMGDTATGAERQLDDTDLQIITALQIDGRASFADLAKGIDLSQAAIRLRVNRLLESGVLDIVAITDPLQIGFTVEAMIGLTVDGDIDEVSAKVGALDSAVYVVLTAGRFDLMVEVLCADNDHLLEVMSDLRALDGVSSLEAHTYLRLTKQTYAWGIPPPPRAT
ncbi:MAG: Lrp/AsnC family transcriptional regulator [Acidimicrobiia bacterium]